MDHFLVFNSHRNQFKWTGSVEQFESYMIQRLNVSKEDIQSKCNNGTCMVWMTPNVTFNFYLKTKTLQVQGKAVDPIREILFQSLGQSHQDATADETVFGNEMTTYLPIQRLQRLSATVSLSVRHKMISSQF